jgi:hypothetical protein
MANATLTESDGSVVPVVWRSFLEADEPLPLYPSAAVAWVRHLRDPIVRAGSGAREPARGDPTH